MYSASRYCSAEIVSRIGARACAGMRVDERWIDASEQFLRVIADEVFDFTLKETRFEQCVENGLLGNEFIANGVADRLRQLFPVTRNHALRPDRETKQFH